MLCEPCGYSTNEIVVGAIGSVISAMKLPLRPAPLALRTSNPSAWASR
jgi:hypothetical protein